MPRKTRKLSSEEIWVTEYNRQYGTCCGIGCRKEDAPLENEQASAEIASYPRLVKRDDTPAVVVMGQSMRRGPSIKAAFHSVVSWPNWKLVLGVIVSCVFPWMVIGTIYYVLDALDVVESMGETEYQSDDSWSSSFFLTAYTATSVGYVSLPPSARQECSEDLVLQGNDRPGTASGYLGSLFPLFSYHLQLAINAFWLAVMIGRISNGHPLAHSILFANRAVMQDSPTRGRMFQCRFINLRTDYPWIDIRVQMFYISFNTKEKNVTKRPLLLEEYTGNGRGDWHDASAESVPPFMTVPTSLTHYISKGSILDISAEEMIAQRGEVAVMLEGYDPCTGRAVKTRFSYIANEIFMNAEYTNVLSLNSVGQYEVDLSQFHCTQPHNENHNSSLQTNGTSGWVAQ